MGPAHTRVWRARAPRQMTQITTHFFDDDRISSRITRHCVAFSLATKALLRDELQVRHASGRIARHGPGAL
jgi:hypothetical protein|eukprot:4067766-Prymnesium_polylepis.2